MLTEGPEQPRILIVDDQEANIHLLSEMLSRAGLHNYVSTQDSRNALPMWQDLQPDLIVLDLHMPHMDGFAVMAQLKSRIPEETYLPILVLTADALPAAKKKALALGATDFLSKPFDAVEVVLRIRNLLKTRSLHLSLQHENQNLEHKVAERTRNLEEAQIELLERLAAASEARDDETGAHTQRVGALAEALGRRCGWPWEKLGQLRRAASLHDIGKIGIPDRVLHKPGPLTPQEYELMKSHSAMGAKLLSGSSFPIVQLAEQIAYYHHEKWDGSGYYGVSGEAIPLAARIVAISDVFDVLTHPRPYKEAWPLEDALALIESESGKHFDPSLAAEFLQLIRGSSLAALGIALSADPVAQIGVESTETPA